MMYSENDRKNCNKQLLGRIGVMFALLLAPNGIALAIMYTVRIQWLSIALGLLGAAMAIFYWGLYCAPVASYWRYLKEILGGRTHAFTGELTEIALDSVREGVPCKTLFFCDDAGDAQRLCYWDEEKYADGDAVCGQRYRVTVHGQSIVAIERE